MASVKNIIIFEGTGKTRFDGAGKYKADIEKKLGGSVYLEATGGHFLGTDPDTLDINIDIEKKDISVDLKCHDNQKKKLVKDLGIKIKEVIDSGGKVYIFTDSDRAGEMIAREVITHFKLKKGQYLRKGIASLEKADFMKYFDESVSEYNENFADSDQSRMILDKLWGYVKSPHLWGRISKEGRESLSDAKKSLEDSLNNFRKENAGILNEKRIKEFEKSIEALIEEVGSYEDDNKFKDLFKTSIGRVQIPMLRLVADTFLDSFKKVKLSNSLRVLDANGLFWAVATDKIEKKEEDGDDENANGVDVDAIYDAMKNGKEVIVTSVSKRNRRMGPPTPYNDTSLQSDGTKILGLSPMEIGEIGQKLYERGIVTYYRSAYTGYTDGSVDVISQLIKDSGEKLVKRDYPLEAGAGHDAIHVTYKGAIVKQGEYFIPDIWLNERVDLSWMKFFDMVYRRTLAGFMQDVEFEETTLIGTVCGHPFNLTINNITNYGFTSKYYWSLGSIRNAVEIDIVSKYTKGAEIGVEEVKLEKGKFKFNSRVSYDSFQKKLEKYSISTSATFLPIFGVITNDKGYANYDKKSNVIDLTAKGWIVYNMVKDYDVFDLETTERLEKALSKIEKGTAKMKDVLWLVFQHQFLDNGYFDFYKNWKDRKATGGTKKDVDRDFIPGEKCDKCGGKIYIMEGVSKTSGKPFKMAKCEKEKSENKNGKWVNSGCTGPTNRWR